MNDKEIKSRFESLVEETVGLSINDIKNGGVDMTHKCIEDREKMSLSLGRIMPGVAYRGNMLLASGRINYDISTKFDKTFGIDGQK